MKIALDLRQRLNWKAKYQSLSFWAFSYESRGEYCTTGLSQPIYRDADPNSNNMWTEVMKYAKNRIMVKANFFSSAGPNFNGVRIALILESKTGA